MPREKIVNFVVKQPFLSLASKSSPKAQWACTGETIPVNRIYCVGRNYREHAIEMGGDPDREPPFFFHKPGDAVVDTGIDERKIIEIPYPPLTQKLHHEIELVLVLGRGGLRIPVETASDHIFGYAVGCDLTRRDLQAEAKAKGRPWCSAKGFDYSAPCGCVVQKKDFVFDPQQTTIKLEVNGERKQESTLDKLIWSPSEIISTLSNSYTLKPGDLIFTGTPAGVGPLVSGDTVSGMCGNLPHCTFKVTDPL